MEDSEAVAAPASAEESNTSKISPSPPSSSPAPPAPYDPLAKALQTLFLNVTFVVQGELQAVNSDYELLERMNLRVASEHDNQAEFAQGLRVFVENLKQKNDGFSEYIREIDELDQEVTELEALCLPSTITRAIWNPSSGSLVLALMADSSCNILLS